MQAPFSRTLFELLDEQSRSFGTAVISGEENLTYAQLADRARRAASVLRAHGVRRGERVGLLINNCTEWLEVAFGAWLLGAVATPFTTWCTRHELEYLIADSEVTALVAVPRFAREDYAAMLRDFVTARTFPRLGAVLMIGKAEGFPEYAGLRDAAEPAPTPAPGDGASAADDAIILYTSGSTSKPKAIALAHYLVIENGFNIGERQGLGPADKVLLSPPLFWTYGGVNALPATFTHGAALVLQGRFEAGESLALIERHGCTSLYTLPGMTAAMISHPEFRRERTRTLRVGMTIGSPQDVISAADVLGAAGICNVYGSSETGGNCCVTHHDWPLERAGELPGAAAAGGRVADRRRGVRGGAGAEPAGAGRGARAVRDARLHRIERRA